MDTNYVLFTAWQKAVRGGDFLFSGGVVASFSPRRGCHIQIQVHGNAILLYEKDNDTPHAYFVMGGYSSDTKSFWLLDCSHTNNNPGPLRLEDGWKAVARLFWLSASKSLCEHDGQPLPWSDYLPGLKHPYREAYETLGEWDGDTGWFTSPGAGPLAIHALNHMGDKADIWDLATDPESNLPLLVSNVGIGSKDESAWRGRDRMSLLKINDGDLSNDAMQKLSFLWRFEEAFIDRNLSDEDNHLWFKIIVESIYNAGPGWYEWRGDNGFWKNQWGDFPRLLNLKDNGSEPPEYIQPDGRVVGINLGRMLPPDACERLVSGGPLGNPADWSALVQAFGITNALRSY